MRNAGRSTSRAASDGPLDITIVEFLPSGGMYQFAFQFADALARSGHRVTLITGAAPELRSTTPDLEVLELLPTWHPNEPLGAVSPWRAKVRRWYRALLLVESWRRVFLHVRRTRPDVVQFGELRYAVDTLALLVTATWGGARLVVDVAHNPLPYDVNNTAQAVEKAGQVTLALLARAYRACDLVMVLGEGPRADLLSHFPRVRRTAVCGHGDYSSVLATESVPLPSTAGPTALVFGAWTKYKNIPLLLEAFALVRGRVPEARLTLAGPVMPDVDVEAITARALEIGGVDLRPGYVAMEDVPGLFAAHRVVVFTYATVNISGSVHMAYTFGRPVVATDVGSMSDAVDDGVTGRLAKPDAQSVADAIVEVILDDRLADRLGATARERGLGNESWSVVAAAAVEAYRRAAEAGPTS